MHLYAIGIYDNESRQKNEVKKINFAQKSKPNLFSNPDDLEQLEKNSLPYLPQEMNAGFYKFADKNEYHYCMLSPNGKNVMSIVSRGELEKNELFYLFINIHHAHVRAKALNFTLNDIIINPQGFISSDKQPDAIIKELDDTKNIMLKNITLIIQRGESLDSLSEKAFNLTQNSFKLHDKAKEVHDRYKCCRYM